MQDIEYKKARVQLDFFSLVRLSSLIGFCFGVVLIPITFLYNLSNETESYGWYILIVILGAPFMSFLQGVITGVLGYPLYKIITNKYEIMYEGKFSIGKPKNMPSNKAN